MYPSSNCHFLQYFVFGDISMLIHTFCSWIVFTFLWKCVLWMSSNTQMYIHTCVPLKVHSSGVINLGIFYMFTIFGQEYSCLCLLVHMCKNYSRIETWSGISVLLEWMNGNNSHCPLDHASPWKHGAHFMAVKKWDKKR